MSKTGPVDESFEMDLISQRVISLKIFISNFPSKYLSQDRYKAWSDSIKKELNKMESFNNPELFNPELLVYNDFLILYLMDSISNDTLNTNTSMMALLNKILADPDINFDKLKTSNAYKNINQEAQNSIMRLKNAVDLSQKISASIRQNLQVMNDDNKGFPKLREQKTKVNKDDAQSVEQFQKAVHQKMSDLCVINNNLSEELAELFKIFCQMKYKDQSVIKEGIMCLLFAPIPLRKWMDNYESYTHECYHMHSDIQKKVDQLEIVFTAGLLCGLLMSVLVVMKFAGNKDISTSDMLHNHNHNLEDDTVKDSSILV